MSDFKLTWNGKRVLKRTNKATLVGINKTMAQAVEHAKNNHAWKNRTGTLEGSIKIVKYAHKVGKGAQGEWGSADVVYAIVHELGSKKRNIPPRPYLRPAADVTYKNLIENIRRAS